MYEFNGAKYDRSVSEDQINDIKERLFRTHPTPYSKRNGNHSSVLPRDPPNKLGEYIPEYQYANVVRDYRTTMGLSASERVTPPAHIDWRRVCIDNASDSPLNIGVNNSPFDPPDKILFSLQPDENRFILINSFGGSEQYLWPFWTSAKSCGSKDSDGKCLAAGPPRILARNANLFVIKSGVQGVWITLFRNPTFKAH